MSMEDNNVSLIVCQGFIVVILLSIKTPPLQSNCHKYQTL